MKVDCQPELPGLPRLRRHRNQFHLLDQRPQRLLRLVHPLSVRKTRDQLADPDAIGRRHTRMDPQRIRGRGGRKLPLQALPSLVKVQHPDLDLPGRHPGDDRIHQFLVVSADLLQVPFQIGAANLAAGLQPIALGGIFLAEDLHGFVIHQVVFECVQHPVLQIALPDHRHIGAGSRALLAGGRAAEAVLGHVRKPAASASGGHQAGEQELRPPPVPDRHIGGLGLHCALSRLHVVPQRVTDDPQVRHCWFWFVSAVIRACRPHPFAFNSRSRSRGGQQYPINVRRRRRREAQRPQLSQRCPPSLLRPKKNWAENGLAAERNGTPANMRERTFMRTEDPTHLAPRNGLQLA